MTYSAHMTIPAGRLLRRSWTKSTERQRAQRSALLVRLQTQAAKRRADVLVISDASGTIDTMPIQRNGSRLLSWVV